MPDKLRTKQSILDALVALTETMPFEQIAVKQICERAQISRQTFYAYFRDKYDAALWAVEPTIQGIFSRLGRDIGWRQAYLQLFETFEKNPWGLMKMIQSNDRNSIQNSTIRSSREDFTNAYIARYGKEPDELIAYQIERFSITASVATDDWLLSGCAIPAEQFVDRYISLIPRELFVALDVPEKNETSR